MISGVLRFWELACPLGVLDTGMDSGILGSMAEQWDFVRVVSWGKEREEEAYKQFKEVMWLILDEKF